MRPRDPGGMPVLREIGRVSSHDSGRGHLVVARVTDGVADLREDIIKKPQGPTILYGQVHGLEHHEAVTALI